MPEVTVPQPAPAASPASPPGRPKPKFNKRKVRQAVLAGAVVVALNAATASGVCAARSALASRIVTGTR